MILATIKSMVRHALYHSGMLAAFHRVRNRHTVTTLMFHRVLPRESTEYSLAEREFTFTVEGFAQCLAFVQKHYNVVRLKDVRVARSGGKPLPPNAALITFDDGWRDTLTHAYRELKVRNLTALLFVATEAMEDESEIWWQYQLVNVLQNVNTRRALIARLRTECQVLNAEHPSDREITGVLSRLSVQGRMDMLSQFDASPAQPRQMLRWNELAQADQAYIEIGAHGHTHVPLTHAERPMEELQRSHSALCGAGIVADSMSFPHGAYDAGLVTAAKAAGFRFVFTSDANLARVSKDGLQGNTFGRIHVPENIWTCNEGAVSFPKLATFLFFRPIA